MPILAKSAGAKNLNKFYLEQALLAFSVSQPDGYLDKCRKINMILNKTVKDEVTSGKYQERIELPEKDFDDIFG